MQTSRVALTLGVLSLLSGVGACRRIEESSTPARAGKLSLIYTSNIDGELEPCG